MCETVRGEESEKNNNILMINKEVINFNVFCGSYFV